MGSIDRPSDGSLKQLVSGLEALSDSHRDRPHLISTQTRRRFLQQLDPGRPDELRLLARKRKMGHDPKQETGTTQGAIL